MYDDTAGHAYQLDAPITSGCSLAAPPAPAMRYDQRPLFDQLVPANGYLWWYTDALSDDDRYGLTLIALIGSVFSPYYARARQRQAAVNPEQYCAINVAFYDRQTNKSLWAMTERGQSTVRRQPTQLTIGPSQLSWEQDALVIHLNEITAPIPHRLRGTIRLMPRAMTTQQHQLDQYGRHYWWPIAPESRIEVQLQQPRLHWAGNGYLDSNWGNEPLAAGFHSWDWSRAKLPHETAVLYDVRRHDQTPLSLALRFNQQGDMTPFTPPPRRVLTPTRWWQIPRMMQSDTNETAVLETLEDTPFYARSTVRATLLGQTVHAVHESLSLERFVQPWVQLLLPVRMPRRG